MHLRTLTLVCVMILIIVIIYMGYKAVNNMQNKLLELESRLSVAGPRSPLAPMGLNLFEEDEEDEEAHILHTREDSDMTLADMLPPDGTQLPNHSLLRSSN